MMTPSIKAKCSSEVKWRVPLEICEPFVRIESKQKAKTYHTVILTKNCINIFILLLHSLRERQTGNRKVGVVYCIAVVNEINVDNRQMNRIPNAMWRAHSIVFVLLLVYCWCFVVVVLFFVIFQFERFAAFHYSVVLPLPACEYVYHQGAKEYNKKAHHKEKAHSRAARLSVLWHTARVTGYLCMRNCWCSHSTRYLGNMILIQLKVACVNELFNFSYIEVRFAACVPRCEPVWVQMSSSKTVDKSGCKALMRIFPPTIFISFST